MKMNTVIAGLLGIALGAGATVAVAHGVLGADEPVQIEASPEQAVAEEAPGDIEAEEVTRAPTRPLRPGSTPLGHAPIRTPAQS